MLIKVFLLVTIFILVTSQQILQKYDNGNYGAGPNNVFTGANNTWIGASNKIIGNENKVKGDENKIRGNNNTVVGIANVVGDMSPQEITQMQNQMTEKVKSKLSSLGIFETPASTNSTKNQTSTIDTITPPSSNQKSKEATKIQTSQKEKIKHQQNTKIQQGIQKSNETSKRVLQQQLKNQAVEVLKKSINRLLFRIYGRQNTQNSILEQFNQNDQSNQIKQTVLKNLNKDFSKQRRIFYLSLQRALIE